MKDVQRSVRDGQPMSAPLVRHSVFPPMVTQMMEVGEETGQVSAMLDKVADFYDHEVEIAAESLTAAIEPVMVVRHGRDHRHDGHLPVPADVHDLPAHPGRELMSRRIRISRLRGRDRGDGARRWHRQPAQRR